MTPLQRRLKEERAVLSDLRKKRRENRKRTELMCMHVPLSSATTAPLSADAGRSTAEELELERAHRRVATRGAVALFNAISEHRRDKKRREADRAGAEVGSNRRRTLKEEGGKRVTKRDFLDLVKSGGSGAAASSGADRSSGANGTTAPSGADDGKPSSNPAGEEDAVRKGKKRVKTPL